MSHPGSWTLRPATPEDEAFLFRVFFHTRNEELAATGLPAPDLEALLRTQFRIRELQYHSRFPEAAFDLVLREHLPVGQLAVSYTPKGIHLIDLALLPEHRGQGLGTLLLEHLIAKAQEAACPLTLQVDADNPARRLYERLGFAYAETGGRYLAMTRQVKSERGSERGDLRLHRGSQGLDQFGVGQTRRTPSLYRDKLQP